MCFNMLHVLRPQQQLDKMPAVLLCYMQLISTVLTIALLGGAAWFYFQYSGSDSAGSNKSSGKQDSDVDLDDPLAEARRIMDKYKK